MIDIFDSIGRVAPDKIDPSAIDKMPDDQREALLACIAACRIAEDAEDRLAVARKSVTEKMRVYDEALAADQLANPPIDRISALRAVIAANQKR
jgi:phytoene/squalene synthetase